MTTIEKEQLNKEIILGCEDKFEKMEVDMFVDN